jgi:alkylhydroperoxidase family enzyme
VLSGRDSGLTEQEQAMTAWARKVVKNPNTTSPADVQALRDAGLTDEQIFAVTVFVALRVAFSMVNDALGALPTRN